MDAITDDDWIFSVERIRILDEPVRNLPRSLFGVASLDVEEEPTCRMVQLGPFVLIVEALDGRPAEWRWVLDRVAEHIGMPVRAAAAFLADVGADVGAVVIGLVLDVWMRLRGWWLRCWPAAERREPRARLGVVSAGSRRFSKHTLPYRFPRAVPVSPAGVPPGGAFVFVSGRRDGDGRRGQRRSTCCGGVHIRDGNGAGAHSPARCARTPNLRGRSPFVMGLASAWPRSGANGA